MACNNQQELGYLAICFSNMPYFWHWVHTTHTVPPLMEAAATDPGNSAMGSNMTEHSSFYEGLCNSHMECLGFSTLEDRLGKGWP